MGLRVDILTLFPEMFGPVLGTSIPKRAAEKGAVSYHLTDIRDFATDAHKSVDDRPFGGGPGMVMMAPTMFDAVEAAEKQDPRPARRILLSPQGRLFDQALAEELAREERLLLIAGHYEGFDERIVEGLKPLGLSIGDYVLSGNHAAIAAWRMEQRKLRTKERRPDLWRKYTESSEGRVTRAEEETQKN